MQMREDLWLETTAISLCWEGHLFAGSCKMLIMLSVIHANYRATKHGRNRSYDEILLP